MGLAAKLNWDLAESRPCGDDEKYPEKCGSGDAPGNLGRRMENAQKTMERLKLLINNPANKKVRQALIEEFRDQKSELLALKELTEDLRTRQGLQVR